jgi:hypothetical protein
VGLDSFSQSSFVLLVADRVFLYQNNTSPLSGLSCVVERLAYGLGPFASEIKLNGVGICYTVAPSSAWESNLLRPVAVSAPLGLIVRLRVEADGMGWNYQRET